MDQNNGEQLFKEKYGIEYNTLTEIKKDNIEQGMYKQNFKILYHTETDRYFSLWSSPYKHFIYIQNHGFIVEDISIKNYYKNKTSNTIHQS